MHFNLILLTIILFKNVWVLKFNCIDDTPNHGTDDTHFLSLLPATLKRDKQIQEEHRGCFERARARAVQITLALGRPEFD